jgi:hypothetical protein
MSLLTNITDTTVAGGGVHAGQHNLVNTAVLALQAGGGAPSATRTTASYTSPSLAVNGVAQGSITLAKSYRILQVVTSVAARVRLYDRAAKQTADVNRPVGNVPTGDHGVICDFVGTPALLSVNATPPIIGSSMEATPSTSIPITVNNLSGAVATISVALEYFAEE